jgi:hypothetical protein
MYQRDYLMRQRHAYPGDQSRLAARRGTVLL